ncbi:HD domain-containing protein [Rubrivirga sp.]|uniref:HD domain-containing protein n=1 Tax=Rubrivirga sp. TaxID=1885344 RepID=UPI003C774E36
MSDLFSPLVEHAIETAAEWHDGTYRKGRWTDSCIDTDDVGRVPTMAHVTTVALTVQRAGWNDHAVAAAFLHDALEDGNRHRESLSRDALVARVGERVVRIVEAVSEPKTDLEGVPLPWRARKEAYLERLASGPVEAAAVSLADKLHNAYAMSSSLEAGIDIFCDGPNRRGLSAGAQHQRWFFVAVLDVSRRHPDDRLVWMRRRLEGEVQRFEGAAGL